MAPPPKANKQGVILRTDEEKKRWKALLKLDSQPSRYPSLTVVRGLGIERSWNLMLEAGSLKQLFTMQYDSYHNLTVEFLSTLKVTREDGEVQSMSFRLRNGEYSLTLAQFNTIFKFHGEDDAVTEEPEHYDRHAFWEAITIQADPNVGYRPAKAKNNEVRNPALRYMLKALVYLPFAHKEAGSCQSEELFILWGIMYGQKINTGHFIIKFLERQVSKTSGKLCFGGLVSRLAHALDVDVSCLVADVGTKLIDWDVLKTTKFITVDSRSQGYFLQNAQDSFPFPRPQLTAVGGWHYRDNWQMNTEAHVQLCAANPPRGKGRSDQYPNIPWHIVDPEIPEPPLMLEGPEGEAQEIPAENMEHGEGSQPRRRSRMDVLEDQMRTMTGEMASLNVAVRDGFARHDAHWATYMTHYEAELKWRHDLQQMFPNWPQPPPQ